MSKLRRRLLANNPEDKDVQDVVEEQAEQPVENQEEQIPQQEQPVEEQTQEQSTNSILDVYSGDKYLNQWGKVTPYHIIFNDYADEIANLNKQQAIETCISLIDELNAKYSGDPDYTNPSPQAVEKFKNAIRQSRDGMGVLFKVKDFLLASEGMSVTSSLEQVFTTPKIAKKINNVMSKLIEIHEKMKKQANMNKKAEVDSKEDIANYIEELDATVIDDDRDEFYNIINSYLNSVDPENELTIYEAVLKLDNLQAKNLLHDLLDLTYESH
jgi:hypothetical protein